jgi:hypothetical protein
MTLTDGSLPAAPYHPLSGRGVHLVALRPDSDDLSYLYSWETSSDFAPRWRLRGMTPPFDEWLRGIMQGTLAQFLVWDGPTLAEARHHGVILAYDTDLRDGYTHLASAAFDARDREGEEWPTRMTIAFAIFVQHLFTGWPLRKVYLNVPAFNLGDSRSWARPAATSCARPCCPPTCSMRAGTTASTSSRSIASRGSATTGSSSSSRRSGPQPPLGARRLARVPAGLPGLGVRRGWLRGTRGSGRWRGG